MTELQKKLDELYPNKEAKEKVKEIIIQGGVIDLSTNLPFSEEEINEIDGGKLDLSGYPNLEKVIINGYHLKTKLTEFRANGCAKLNILNLSFNELNNLDINNCPQLKVFYCAYNKLNNLDFLTNLKSSSLTSLKLGNNDFYSDLSCFANFTNLENLEVDSNYYFF
jgi:Leucine-rich repeat (LRR) protein